ncbi:hypothetical protein [Micromonospora endolithica]|uniref:Uncharacterized protein n=1 Tax=Micromonospora endolithica TaxID=230091 RepID=A0A3A9Z6E1_9ACTN|nr:hypothetical protein [Micromonospora endolithica]RKN43434.1 hypothetical protein D7223_20490 [Micromonospora endolithica]TWJ24005.1 hypothetical protein JD76_04151 [Micromonospora endolithica]
MSPFLALFLVLVLGAASYAAGRLHGQLSYRIGYRFGYRQGYFDGDRGAWNRRRRDAQAAIASALAGPPVVDATAQPVRATGTVARAGTTYTGSSFTTPAAPVAARHPAGTLVRRTG